MTHERLLATAAELGITPEAVEHAERTVRSQRENETLRREFARHVKKDFYSHLTTYLIINSFLVLMNVFTSHGLRIGWAIWPILGWGIGILFHAREAFVSGGSDYEAKYQAWAAKRNAAEPPLKGAGSQ